MSCEPHILLVDDEESNVDMLSRRLRRVGYDVSSARDGKEALDILSKRQVDLVLLDQMMPGMTGLDVLREVRLPGPRAKLPVIMVTAVSDSRAVAEALNSGANDYITKPVDFPIALARIQGQLARGLEQAAMQRREERYALAIQGNGSGIWDWDLRTGSIYASGALCELLGEEPVERQFSLEEISARVWPRDRAALRRALGWRDSSAAHAASVEISHALSAKFRIRHADGSYRWVHLDGVTTLDSSGVAIRRVGQLTDVTAEKTTDAGSGLLNRTGLVEQIELKLNRQEKDLAATLLLFQIRAFAELSLGVPTALLDVLVRQIAARATETVAACTLQGNHAVLARLKDDTFAVLIDHTEGDGLPETIAANLHQTMKQAFPAGKRSAFIELHLGLATLSEETRHANALIQSAGAALAIAETNNNGHPVCFDRSMREAHKRRMKLEHDLHYALEKHEFEVLYQPRVHLETGRICGFEALVRWHHGHLGMVSPMEFIPIAESNGLICELGKWVLDQSCHQMSQWMREFDLGDEFEMAVNLSIRQCHQRDLVPQISQALTKAQLPAKHLKLEVTESLFANDVGFAKTMLADLKSLGAGLKLDDFGTGYSCFQYLCELPFDSLKIDRSFVRRLEDGGTQAADVIRSVISLGGSLGMEVIAEGIETLEQSRALTAMGCLYGQGFLFSKPVSAAAARLLLARQHVVAA